MLTADFIETLRAEGDLLAAAAERAGLDAPVPTCPGWRVRDLLAHTGSVHRWAASYVVEGHAVRRPMDRTAPGDAELAAWYRRVHRRLVDALTAAPADLDCWFFFGAPSPLAFWARRQAHETAIHRIDAEAALGAARSPVDPAFAADGVDELLTGIQTDRRSTFRSQTPRTLRVRAVDAPGGDWLVRLSAAVPVVERDAAGDADCTVSGPAADLYATLWNRGSYDALTVTGDDSLVTLWRRTGAVD